APPPPGHAPPPVTRDNGIGDAFVTPSSISLCAGLRWSQEPSRACPLSRRGWGHAHLKSDSSPLDIGKPIIRRLSRLCPGQQRRSSCDLHILRSTDSVQSQKSSADDRRIINNQHIDS